MEEQTVTRSVRLQSRKVTAKRSRSQSILLGTIGVVASITLWEIVSRTGLLNTTYFPPFTMVVGELLRLLGDGAFWRAFASTLTSWSLGLAMALVAGVVLGIVIGSSRYLQEWTASTIEFLRPIPSVALIPIAIVVFGIKPEATVSVVTWACFWVLIIHVIRGVVDVDPVAMATARSYGLSPFWRARFVIWPTVLPYLMTGLRLAGTVALIVAITTELVVGSAGLGALIALNQSAGEVEAVYALALLTGFLGLGINVVLKVLERSILSWHQSVRSERAE